jgi:hypothetical protein
MIKVRFQAGEGSFSSLPYLEQFWYPLASYQIYTGGVSPVVKRLESEDNSSVFSAEIKNAWSYTSAPTCRQDVKFN